MEGELYDIGGGDFAYCVGAVGGWRDGLEIVVNVDGELFVLGLSDFEGYGRAIALRDIDGEVVGFDDLGHFYEVVFCPVRLVVGEAAVGDVDGLAGIHGREQTIVSIVV